MYNRQDIRIKIGENGFDVRACGILLEGEQLLISNEPDGNRTLTGGAVKIGETTAEAVIREFQEETGLAVEVVRLVAIIENFLIYQNADYHQFIYVYGLKRKMTAVGMPVLAGEEKLLPQWVKFDKLEGKDLRPKILNEVVRYYQEHPQGEIIHLIQREG